MREILFRGQTRKKGQKVWMDGTPVDGQWVYGGVTQLEDIPAADVVEVVRCKNCKMEYGCRVTQWLGENGFCSYGERKDGAE